MQQKRVFITVGTTKFEELIRKVSEEPVLDLLHELGYKYIQFQTGNGEYKEVTHPHLVVQYERFFDNFEEEINKCDLVISHAGAGTCLEVLQKGKPLIVVVNERLMDNHQIELAEELQSNGFLYYGTCNNLVDVLKKDLNELKAYPKPDNVVFRQYLDKVVGFT